MSLSVTVRRRRRRRLDASLPARYWTALLGRQSPDKAGGSGAVSRWRACNRLQRRHSAAAGPLRDVAVPRKAGAGQPEMGPEFRLFRAITRKVLQKESAKSIPPPCFSSDLPTTRLAQQSFAAWLASCRSGWIRTRVDADGFSLSAPACALANCCRQAHVHSDACHRAAAPPLSASDSIRSM